MMVNGPLEIYSTVIGVKIFDSLFNILASMGIIFLPLIVMFFQNITIPYESEIENGASTSLRTVAIQFSLWVIAVMLFIAPTWKIDIEAIKYTPVCFKNATPSKFGDTGTTYDDVFSKVTYQDLRLPLMMVFTLSGMSGFTNAAITSLPCKTDVQAIKDTINTVRLTPEVAQQVDRFQNECFAPARTQFDSQKPEKSSYEETMKSYGGLSDLSWIGSHVFQTLYYPNLYPTTPVHGFPNAEFPYQYHDYNSKHGEKDATAPKWGYPNCKAWWGDKNYGLQKQLVDLVKTHTPANPHLGTVPIKVQLRSYLARIKNYAKIEFGSQVTADDIISHSLLYDVGSQSGFGRGYSGWMDLENSNQFNSSSADRFFTHGAAQIGQGINAAYSSVERAELSQEIVILQAVLIALVLALGPLILMLGMLTGRTISVTFTYYFLVGSLYFITYVEKLLHYIELSLHASQSYGLYALGHYTMMYNVFTKLYFFAPMIYLALMSIAGIGIGSALGSAFADKSSGKGVGQIKSTLMSAAKVLK